MKSQVNFCEFTGELKEVHCDCDGKYTRFLSRENWNFASNEGQLMSHCVAKGTAQVKESWSSGKCTLREYLYDSMKMEALQVTPSQSLRSKNWTVSITKDELPKKSADFRVKLKLIDRKMFLTKTISTEETAPPFYGLPKLANANDYFWKIFRRLSLQDFQKHANQGFSNLAFTYWIVFPPGFLHSALRRLALKSGDVGLHMNLNQHCWTNRIWQVWESQRSKCKVHSEVCMNEKRKKRG